MRVAIIGAGIAGLSCALELKKLGIKPVIYEKRPSVGHPLEHTITTFNIFDMSMADPVKKIKKDFAISLYPMYNLCKTVMHGPSKTTTVEGKLGYVFKRGLEPYSIENQIKALVDMPIQVDNYIDIDKIRKNFDSIVVATGDDSIAKQLGLWSASFNVFVRVATVLGAFNTGTMHVWLSTNVSKNCYSYLLPNNQKEACLVFTANDVKSDDMEYYWKEFLFTREIQYKIIETRDCLCNLGFPQTLKTRDNIYFVGNAGGFMDDFLGFGIISSIESGIYAARSIACGKDYNKLTKHLSENVKQIHEYRMAFNKLENNDIDKLLTLIDTPVIKQGIYNNPLFRAKNCSVLLKAYNKLKQR